MQNGIIDSDQRSWVNFNTNVTFSMKRSPIDEMTFLQNSAGQQNIENKVYHLPEEQNNEW